MSSAKASRREHVLRDQHRVVLYAVVFGRHVRVHDDIAPSSDRPFRCCRLGP
jgi:hypothetical protein